MQMRVADVGLDRHWSCDVRCQPRCSGKPYLGRHTFVAGNLRHDEQRIRSAVDDAALHFCMTSMSASFSSRSHFLSGVVLVLPGGRPAPTRLPPCPFAISSSLETLDL